VVETLTVVALALLVVGVVGSVVPAVPGALASLAGIYLYWWSTGYADPSLPVLAAFTLVGGAAVVADYAGGAAAARAGGADLRTVAAAAVAGPVGLALAGPVGLLAATAGTVFALEYRRSGDAAESRRRAVYATVGVLASAAVQITLTALLLLAFLAVLLT